MKTLSIIIILIGIIILVIGIYLFFISGNRISYNKEIEEKNHQLKKDNLILQGESNKLYNEIEFLKKQKQQIYEEQEKAAENYFNILDLTYKTKENEFDIKAQLLQQNYEKELDKEHKSIAKKFLKFQEKTIDHLKEYL